MAANASGKRKALGTSEHRVAKKAIQRIWGEHDKGFRVFLSHRSKSKKKAADLKERLALFGVSCFVAHQDVSPTKAWQDEIELALHSMDAFVALMTKGFHDSLWTDQEVGFAFARAVPIVTLRLGADPYGFIGKFQALSCSLEAAPARIAGLLINQPGMLDFYIDAVARCRNWDAPSSTEVRVSLQEQRRGQRLLRVQRFQSPRAWRRLGHSSQACDRATVQAESLNLPFGKLPVM
jgi:hypothetical protein